MLPLPAVLSRLALLFVLGGAALALSSCAPGDPLDRVVKAKTLNEYLWWEREELPKLDEPLRVEFVVAVNNIRATTPWFKTATTIDELNDSRNPLCRRLHGKTVREVLIAGYEARREHLHSSIVTTMNNLQRLYERPDDGRSARRLEAVIKMHQEELKEQNAAIERAEARIAALRATAH